MSILDRIGGKDRKVPREALFWSKEDSKVRCGLCPHRCHITEGKRGICGVRENRDGKLYTLIYGKMTSIMPDPIEKKPLYNFHPGTNVLSFGTVGCNFKCSHCQNWSISQMEYGDVGLKNIGVQEVVESAKKYNCQGIAWTYNEPIIWFEFTLDGCIAAKENDLYTVYVTNGYIEREPLEKIAPYLDAMNIDVKAFNEEFYARICKGKLAPVLETVQRAHELGIHVELTYLIIPGQNDKRDELEDFCTWASSINKDIPLHFSRFHPDYKMTSTRSTPMETLDLAFDLARKSGMRYIYLGNIMPGDPRENTYCPNCNELLVERWGFNVRTTNLKSDRCPRCGHEINVKI